MNEKKDFVHFDYCFVCSKENTFNILISSKPTKVHDEQCLLSSHFSMIYNSDKIQLTTEHFIRISSHKMSTSSSSFCCISCLDALWCFASMLFLLYHDIPFAAKHAKDILRSKVHKSFCYGLFTYEFLYFLPWFVVDICRKWARL
jgi:hypothetical protein